MAKILFILFVFYIQLIGTSADIHQNDKYDILASKMQEYETTIQQLQSQVDTLQKHVQKLEQEKSLKQIHSKDSSMVSFTAYAGIDRNYNKDQTVLFDVVVANYGGYYNSTTGEFPCPAPGYYLFSANLRADFNDVMGAAIMVGDKELVGAIAAYGGGQASTFAVHWCEAGEIARVKSVDNGYRMHGDGKYSSFTGTLLQLE